MCCQHRTFPRTLREHGVPFFVAAPQMYTSSAAATGIFAVAFAGIAASVCGRRSSIEFAAWAGRLSAGAGACAVFTAAFSIDLCCGVPSNDLVATRFALSALRLKKLTKPKIEITDAKSITPFGRNSCSVKSVAHRSQNRRLVHNFHSARSTFSPQLQQKLGRKSIVTYQDPITLELK